MPQRATSIDRNDVVKTAFLKAAYNLGLNRSVINKITDYNEQTITRMSNNLVPEDETKREIFVIFIKMYRSLMTLAGDIENAKEWFYNENFDLGGIPVELVQNTIGLANVANYLDSMRVKGDHIGGRRNLRDRQDV